MNTAVTDYRTLIDALDAAPPQRLFVREWHDEAQHGSATFEQFQKLTADWADFLHERGVAAGNRVVLLMQQGIALMAAFAATMRLGAVPTILAYPNAKVELAKYRAGLQSMAANLRAPFILIDEYFPEQFAVELSGNAATTLIRCPATIPTTGQRSAASSASGPESIAFIQHSSGTTGLQKGVALSHGAVLRQLAHLSEALRLTPEDRIYSWLPLYHDMGLIACFLLPLVCHVPVVMQRPTEWVQRPGTMLKLIHEHRCTLAWMPNFAFQFVPRRVVGEGAQYDLSCLRALSNCSEPVKPESFDEFYSAFSRHGLKREALQSSYAMAENVFAVTQSVRNGPLRIHANANRFRKEQRVELAAQGDAGSVSFTSSGRALGGNRVRIVSERGDTLGPRQVGEILVQSDSLFQGYYNRPDLTAEAMTDGWYRTGDLGFLHEDELFVVGRKKELLIIAGENIHPHDVEEAVCCHAAVHDGRAVALGVFNPEQGTEDLVVIAEVHSEQLSKDEKSRIEREIRANVLAEVGVSVRWLFLKPSRWIVKSTSGKASRSATREKLLREHSEWSSRNYA